MFLGSLVITPMLFPLIRISILRSTGEMWHCFLKVDFFFFFGLSFVVDFFSLKSKYNFISLLPFCCMTLFLGKY